MPGINPNSGANPAANLGVNRGANLNRGESDESSDKSSPYAAFYAALARDFPNRIFCDYLHCFALGVDSSCYAYTPKCVIIAVSEDEIVRILRLSNALNLPVTFRAYATSLSGQALGEGVLIIATKGWENIEVCDGFIRLGCGVVGQAANLALKTKRQKIGPDPATLAVASIGGIVANNSSGMCCGVAQNSYQTLKSLRVILSDGTVLDTSDESSVAAFLDSHAHIIEALRGLRSEILADEVLRGRISRKFQIKNTTGYALNALLDFSDPIEALSHLFVGSEGTLGFISRVELFCVRDFLFRACGLLFFESIEGAAAAVRLLSSHSEIVASAELMDYFSLKSVRDFGGESSELGAVKSLLSDLKTSSACILLQTQSDDLPTLEKNLATIKNLLKTATVRAFYSHEEREMSAWWAMRKALLPITSTLRPKNSAVITEDVCFEIARLGEGVAFLQGLFEKYDFRGIIFGHALAGNLHFIITPNLDCPRERARFEAFVGEMAQGVVNLGGSIKAEHGTGRMVAPFVALEWGERAYALNRRIKAIFDPKNRLNPDVIISEDSRIFAKNLKQMPSLAPSLDNCNECGLCDAGRLFFTQRQKIALLREMRRLEGKNDAESQEILAEIRAGLRREMTGEIAAKIAKDSPDSPKGSRPDSQKDSQDSRLDSPPKCEDLCPIKIRDCDIESALNAALARDSLGEIC